MTKKKIGFEPAGDCLAIEIVDQEPKHKLVIPQSAKKQNEMVDLVVVAVGPDVKHFEVGDVVMCAPAALTFKLDLGEGDKTYMFHREEAICGKFVG